MVTLLGYGTAAARQTNATATAAVPPELSGIASLGKPKIETGKK